MLEIKFKQLLNHNQEKKFLSEIKIRYGDQEVRTI